MVDDMARKYGTIQEDQEKLMTWQEVSRKELDKYYSLGATDNMLKNFFSDRWFCQLVSEACESVSIVETTGLVTENMSKLYSKVYINSSAIRRI